MNIFAMGKDALTARRDVLDIESAIKGRNRAALAGAIAAALMFVIGFLKGTKYAAYVDWITPELALQVGSVGAAALFGIGHWSAGGAIAGLASADNAGAAVGVVVARDGTGNGAGVSGLARPSGNAPASGQGSLDSPVGSKPAKPAAADPVRLQPGAPNNPDNFLPG
jgi:hypothetical protein